jgi:O-antigen ligase
VNIGTIARWLFITAIIALALFIPFSIAGATIAAGFGLLAWILSSIARRREASNTASILHDPLLHASALLVVSASLSVIMSEDFTRAYKDWGSYWILSVCFLMAANLVVRRSRESAFWVLFLSTTLSCLVAFVQRAGGFDMWFIHIRGMHRVASTLFTMTFAGILYVVIVFGISVALRRGISLRSAIVLWTGLAIQFAAILLTVTRGAWVALFAGLVTVCVLVRSKTVVVASAVLIVAVLVFAFMAPKDSRRIISPTMVTKQNDVNIQTRLVLWDIARDLIKQYPALGVGMGDFTIEADKRVGERKPLTTTDAHNIYLQVLATRGLFGFLPFALFWVVMFRSLFSVKAGSQRGSLQWHYAAGAIGATVAVLFGALTENNLDDEEVFIAYMFVVGLALSARYAVPPAARGAKETGAGAAKVDRR